MFLKLAQLNICCPSSRICLCVMVQACCMCRGTCNEWCIFGLEHFAYFVGPLRGCKLYLRYFTRCIFLLQVSGAGYNDQGEIHIHKCDSPDRARDSIYTLLEVRMCVTADGPCHVVASCRQQSSSTLITRPSVFLAFVCFWYSSRPYQPLKMTLFPSKHRDPVTHWCSVMPHKSSALHWGS